MNLRNFFLKHITMISGLKMKNCPILKESDKEESYDLPDMPPLEGDEEVKLDPEETTAYKAKLNAQKKKQEQN